jgi:hypothetical protein
MAPCAPLLRRSSSQVQSLKKQSPLAGTPLQWGESLPRSVARAVRGVRSSCNPSSAVDDAGDAELMVAAKFVCEITRDAGVDRFQQSLVGSADHFTQHAVMRQPLRVVADEVGLAPLIAVRNLMRPRNFALCMRRALARLKGAAAA